MIYLTCQFLLQTFSCENKQLWRKNNANQTNPRQHVSKSTRLGQSHHATSHWSTLERARWLLFAWKHRPPGGTRHCNPCCGMETQLLEFLFVVVPKRIQ